MDYDRHHFSILARYNAAANRALFGHVAALGEEAYSAPRGSFFGSIGGILTHLISADINWLRRFRELFPAEPSLGHSRLEPAGHVWTKYAFDGFDGLASQRSVVDGIFESFVAGADTARFGEILAYSDSGGNPRRYVFREALDHVFNHQTHHRGQVSQILDELGVEHDFSDILDVLETP